MNGTAASRKAGAVAGGRDSQTRKC